MEKCGRWDSFKRVVAHSPRWVCGAIALLILAWWARSYSASDWIASSFADPNHYTLYNLCSGSGQINFGYVRARQGLVRINTAFGWNSHPAQPLVPRTTFWTRLGFHRYANHRGRQLTLGLVLPHWFVALPFAAVPAWHAARAVRRRRRLARGRCPNCGYDLRGAPGACPECGANAPAPPVAAPLRTSPQSH